MSHTDHSDLGLVQKTSDCGCGCTDSGVPQLDARAIPHAIRHGAIHGAIGSLQPGAALDLIAPHDPLPLLAQVEQREGAAVTFDYVQRGPDAWVLRFTRRA